jgi:hypothetical protein
MMKTYNAAHPHARDLARLPPQTAPLHLSCSAVNHRSGSHLKAEATNAGMSEEK